MHHAPCCGRPERKDGWELWRLHRWGESHDVGPREEQDVGCDCGGGCCGGGVAVHDGYGGGFLTLELL